MSDISIDHSPNLPYSKGKEEKRDCICILAHTFGIGLLLLMAFRVEATKGLGNASLKEKIIPYVLYKKYSKLSIIFRNL